MRATIRTLLIFLGPAFLNSAMIENAAAQDSPASASLKDILVELDKPIATPTPQLKYRCTEQGVKDALSDLIKLGYRMENVQQTLGGKQQRMINDIEKFVKSASKDPSANEKFDAIEKDALAYADGLDSSIRDGEQAFLLISPIKEVCSLDTVTNNRAAADLNRRIVAVQQVFPRLKQQPEKLREALRKVRQAFRK